jgi:hypothetical protein
VGKNILVLQYIAIPKIKYIYFRFSNSKIKYLCTSSRNIFILFYKIKPICRRGGGRRGFRPPSF